jgi:hypothetical protein
VTKDDESIGRMIQNAESLAPERGN